MPPSRLSSSGESLHLPTQMSVLPVSWGWVAFAAGAAKSCVFSPLKYQRGLRASTDNSSKSSWNVSLCPGVAMLVTAKIGCLLIPFLATHTQFEIAMVQYSCSCYCESVKWGSWGRWCILLVCNFLKLKPGLLLDWCSYRMVFVMQMKFSVSLLLTLRKLLFATKLWPEWKSHKPTCVNLFVCLFLKGSFRFHRLWWLFLFSFATLQRRGGFLALSRKHLCLALSWGLAVNSAATIYSCFLKKNVNKYSMVPYPITQGNASSHGNKLFNMSHHSILRIPSHRRVGQGHIWDQLMLDVSRKRLGDNQGSLLGVAHWQIDR